jgi:hypothetical protein
MALPSKELSDSALDALITREQTRIVAPLTEWRDLSLALRQEGLVRDVAAGPRPSAKREFTAEPKPRGPGWLRATGRATMRIAAAAALVGAGVIAGRGMTFGQGIINEIHMAMADSTDGGNATVRVGNTHIASTSDARRSLVAAQTEYDRAATYLATHQDQPPVAGDPSLYTNRLVGLDEMTAASLTALRDAPRDPVLNDYFLSAAAAREATIQQLGNSLPAGSTLSSF